MLNIGILLGDDDDDDADQLPSTPAAQHHPFQPLQITPGFLYCPQLVFSENNIEPMTPRVFCSFVDNNYQQDFSSSIFHPPTPAC
jgi:hypothetical protein